MEREPHVSTMTLKDTDRGYAAMVKRVFGLRSKAHVDVGILDSGADHGGGVSVLDVAMWQEFGTNTIPERSFIRAWFDEDEPNLRQELTTLMQSVVEGKRTKDQALELLGQRAVARVQARMSEGVPPPNAPSTVRRKGSSTPLIDKGALRSSISYRVEQE